MTNPAEHTIPTEAVEAVARVMILANGGDPDAPLRLTLHKTTIKTWEQVAPLARAAIAVGLEAWPGNPIAEVERLARDYNAARDAHDALLLENERLRAALKEVEEKVIEGETSTVAQAHQYDPLEVDGPFAMYAYEAEGWRCAAKVIRTIKEKHRV